MEKKRRNMIAKGAAIALSLIMAFMIFPMSAAAETGDGDNGATADAAATPDFVPGQLIVVTKQDTSKKQLKSIVKGVDGQVDTVSSLGDDSKAALIEVEEGSELSAATELECEDNVLFVQPNYIYRLDEGEIQAPENTEGEDASEDNNGSDVGEPEAEAIEPKADSDDPDADDEADELGTKDESDFPNDKYYTDGSQKYLAPPFEDGTNAGTINAKGAWDQLAELEELGELDETKKPLVAIIDSGALLDHEDLQGVIIKDKCVSFHNGEQMGFTDIDEAEDDNGHGTKVTGVIGANSNNNEIGIAGVAGNRVRMIVIDPEAPIDDEGNIDLYSIDLAMSIKYATDQGAKLINMSVGAYGRDYICERALKYAWNKGTLCICSAGNLNSPLLHYPSDSPYAVTVMAHTQMGNITTFTNYGVEKDISATGYAITTTTNTGITDYVDDFMGTSSATPLVTGTAALLLAANPKLKPREIKNLLYTSTNKEEFSPEKEGQGFGRISASKAMENLLAKKTAPRKIVINKPSIQLFKGTNTSIEYAIYPGNTKTTKVKFTSSNKKVATVDAYGNVYAKAPGKATIKLKCGSVSAKSKVTVKAIPYKTIDRKPYINIDNITMDDLMDVIPEANENGVTIFENAMFCHQYRVKLGKNETIQTVMTIANGYAFLRIKDTGGKVVASDTEIQGKKPYAAITYKARKAGTYVIQTLWKKPSASTETRYKLVLTSDKGFCEPEVELIDPNNVLFIGWPAVEGADYYRVRKYADSDLTELEFEETVKETPYADESYDPNKANYYTVTSCVESKAGVLYNGETPLFVKLENPMTSTGNTVNVKYKTLKKKSVYLSRDKVMTLENIQGKLTYTKLSGKKKITINKKTGKVKVKKGLKKGKYNVKVRVKSAGNDEYDATTQTVTITISVK